MKKINGDSLGGYSWVAKRWTRLLYFKAFKFKKKYLKYTPIRFL